MSRSVVMDSPNPTFLAPSPARAAERTLLSHRDYPLVILAPLGAETLIDYRVHLFPELIHPKAFGQIGRAHV